MMLVGRLGEGMICFDLRDRFRLELIVSVVLALAVIAGFVWYEVAVKDEDSPMATVVAIGHGFSAAVAVSVVVVSSWAVIKVSKIMLTEWMDTKVTKRVDAEWHSHLERKEKAAEEGREFNEPPPSAARSRS